MRLDDLCNGWAAARHSSGCASSIVLSLGLILKIPVSVTSSSTPNALFFSSYTGLFFRIFGTLSDHGCCLDGPFILFPPYTPNALSSARIIWSQHSFIACCRLRMLHIRFCVYLLAILVIFMKPIGQCTIPTLHTNNNPFSPDRNLFVLTAVSCCDAQAESCRPKKTTQSPQ